MNKKRLLISVFATAITLGLMVCPTMAKEYLIFDRPLNLLGYATQGAGFSLSDRDRFDTEKGLQSALTNLFVEADYKISDRLKFYTSERLSVDWVYPLKHNDSSWHDKEFNRSRKNLNVDDEYWQILNEAHFTWVPENFLFRVGKQVVSWGETDGFRLMDQINPLDTRRGFADVEFENTIIPIWLIRSEYYPRITTTWLQDLGVEFVFNPNADFIPNQDIQLGNDQGGIWAPNIRFDDVDARLGSGAFQNVKEPGSFSRKGHEYAFRVKGVVKDTIVTLNAFYGKENSPIVKFADPLNPFPEVTIASDGKAIIHPGFEGKFPRFRFVGMTASKDIGFLKSQALGSVAPVLRLETFYAFNNTFTDALSVPFSQNTFKEFDEFRLALGFDWKVRIRPLNQRAFFFISPQVFYRRIGGFSGPDPSGPVDWFDTTLTRMGKHNWTTSLFISTVYLNAKLTPSFFWLHDQEFGSDFFRLQATYDWSYNWRFTLGALLFSGKKLPGEENSTFKSNNSFDLFKHKDQIFFKITYKWG